MLSTEAVDRSLWVASFGSGDSNRSELLGGKGAGLAEMTSLGLPVPPGFTITTEACRAYVADGGELPEGLMLQVVASIRDLESSAGKRFADPENPLLVSVRSGAVVSMPGMMDTVLNLGMNARVAEGIARRTGNTRFALDLHRRFVQMYGNVVLGVDGARFEKVVQDQQRRAGVLCSADLDCDRLSHVITAFEELIGEDTGKQVPNDPWVQLECAIQAVFESWNNRRAVEYRNFHGISHDMATAVNVVAMVYGNLDDQSCTGVCFTRDPATGDRKVFGEYLTNAQGEDVVAGTSTPRDISHLAAEMPEVYRELSDIAGRLEAHYRDLQDIEFTVEQGKLYILQTRAGQRSAKAAVTVAVNMADEGLITRDEALLRISADQLDQLLLPTIDESERAKARAEGRLVAQGLAASPGGATGIVAFDADTAVELSGQGVKVILVRPETSPEDVHGMLVAEGIVTSRGGTTSHAAVVARGLGKPCVAGAERLEVSPARGYLRGRGITVRDGEEITVDGTTGEVFVGTVASTTPDTSREGDLSRLLQWADERRRLGVWANADNGRDAQVALDMGAEGIGLCRTEHMFFGSTRLSLVREMILSAHGLSQNPDDLDMRGRLKESLARLEEFQTSDFVDIFNVMNGRPVVIRLLDPPLHEFMPDHDELLEQVVELRTKGTDLKSLAEKQSLLAVLNELRESNPMLGLRGCRLGLKFPEIYAMQVKAIARAASKVSAEGRKVQPEIMVPLVAHGREMALLREALESTIERYTDETGTEIEYKIGAMIELPRAALTANEIAETAEFFSFGTNDLTQTVFGFSRDDAEAKFLKVYLEDEILPEDPFKVLDRRGVGQLMRTAMMLGRHTRPDITLGICGEHGGDPSSIEFFHAEGLDYVSCSPYRVPAARLAAAHAAIKTGSASGSKAPADSTSAKARTTNGVAR